ncbi:MAG: hypothetical protein K2F69_06575 [Bacteroidaceae bacterium]|nr:hypothetical protein [Bacteroidaceae bacterium]
MQLQNIKSLLTIVIPVRIDSEERRKNLRAVLRHLAGLGCRIIVLEADATSTLSGEIWPDGVEHLFVKDFSLVFHRTRYINVLLRMAETRIVAVWDADVLVGYAQIYEAVNNILAGCTIAYPYNGQFVMLPEKMSANMRVKTDFEYLHQLRLSSFLGRKQCGGAYLVHQQYYLQCGGENERFTGWGPEDAERMRRVKILGHKVMWTREGQLFHLYHPRKKNSAYQSKADGDRLRREFVRVCSMDRETLTNYITK